MTASTANFQRWKVEWKIAESSVDEVERMVLEAIAARLEAEALLAS